MNESTIQFIIARVLVNANDALEESRRNPQDTFLRGRVLAYYETLDTIKSELIAHDQDLQAYGLDIDLEKTFL